MRSTRGEFKCSWQSVGYESGMCEREHENERLREKQYRNSRPLALQPQPHLDGLITTCRGEALAIGRPGHAVHSTSMSFVGEQAGTARGTPHLHAPVSASRDKTRLVCGHQIN